MNKKLILFDFDGVLVNTLPGVFEIHNFCNQDLTWEDFQKISEGNFHSEYQKKVDMGIHSHPENWLEKYNNLLSNCVPEELLPHVVKQLAQNYRLYIVSSSPSKSIDIFLEQHNLKGCFISCLGSDIHKSKVVKIRSVLEKENISPKDCIFITDTTGDIKEARECDVGSICVSWGLHSKEKLEKENQFAVVDTPEELFTTINSFFDIVKL